jgi:ssDNA-binding Zn-finger/Zn-ribbon topoisomerase 1
MVTKIKARKVITTTAAIATVSVLATVLLCMYSLVPTAYAMSVGISPSEKSIEIVENESGVVYFAISQGSQENETMTVSTDADWLKAETAEFVLQSMEQKYVKFAVMPLTIGEYTAKIKISTSLPGVVGMSYSATANLNVSVIPSSTTLEAEQRTKAEASILISNAQDKVQEVRSAGGNVVEAENVLISALEEFDKGNYDTAKKLGDVAYSLATEQLVSTEQKKEESKVVLEPLRFALIIIAVGASSVTAVLIYEVLRQRYSKGKLSKVPGVKCPNCKGDMYLAYDGTMIASYVCPKCKYRIIKEKYGLR